MPEMGSERRPFRITLLAWFALILALWNGLRFIQAIRFWSTLKEFHASPNPIYDVVTGGIWSLFWLLIAWCLWHGTFWGRSVTGIGALCYVLWAWFDRLALQKPNSNWPFVLVITVLILLMVLVVLFSPRTRTYFAKR
jgi:hypothetical protein